MHRISPHALCITKHTCSLFGCSSHPFVLLNCEEAVLEYYSFVLNIYGWAGFDSSWLRLWLTCVMQYRHESHSHIKVSLPWLWRDLPVTHRSCSPVLTHPESVGPLMSVIHFLSCSSWGLFLSDEYHLHLEPDLFQYPPTFPLMHLILTVKQREGRQWGGHSSKCLHKYVKSLHFENINYCFFNASSDSKV